MARYWEPWRPRLGDRVRIRISPECPYCQELEDGRYLEPADGRTGTIDKIGKEFNPGHRYRVLWDEKRESTLGPVNWSAGGFFAALELDLIARAPR